MNIKILVLPLDAMAQDKEAKKMEKKNAKKNTIEKNYKNVLNKKYKDKKTPTTDETFMKNIVYKEVLTP